MKSITRILVLFFVGCACFPLSAAVRYVKTDGNDANSGNSWAQAYQNLQTAINAAVSGDEIWVAAGTYFPTKDPSSNASPTDPRDKTFYLKNGVKIFGGFVGTETARSQRNATTNVTILSGDFDGNDVVTGSGSTLTISNNGEDAYHVVLSLYDAATTELDGFTVKGGNANGSSFIILEGQLVVRNHGGGMFNSTNTAPPTRATRCFT